MALLITVNFWMVPSRISTFKKWFLFSMVVVFLGYIVVTCSTTCSDWNIGFAKHTQIFPQEDITCSRFLGRHSLMAGLRILFQYLEPLTPVFGEFSPFFFICFFNHIICKRSHQGSPGVTKRGSLGFPWVPLGSLGFP